MAKRKALNKLTQPLRPALSIILICVVVIVVITILLLRSKDNYVSQQPLQTPLFAPTPTLAPGETAIYSFYIHATSQKTKTQAIRLTPSETGRQFVADIGALFIVTQSKAGRSYVTKSSPQNIFTNYGPPEIINGLRNALAAVRVYREGDGIIQVVETGSSLEPTPK